MFPIGIAYLASSCIAQGHNVKVFDALAYTEDNHIVEYNDLTVNQREKIDKHPSWKHHIHWGANWDRIINAINDFEPDIIGISIMHSPNYDTAYKMIQIARETLPNAVIIVGGMHPSIAAEHVIQNTAADYVIVGEGELSFPMLVKCISEKSAVYNIPGVVYHENKIVKYGIAKCLIADLDTLPFPATEILNIHAYYNTATIITSRGCPNVCKFCSIHPIAGYKFRMRTPENVISEIEHYIKLGVTKFNIEDDNFTFNIARVQRILSEIIERKLKIELYLHNGITAVDLDKKTINLMVKAGVKNLFVGLETTSDKMLEVLQKTFTSIDKIKEISSNFSKEGLRISTSLIIGLPGQTINDIVNDIVTLVQNQILFVTNPFYPIVGSPLYNECIENGSVKKETDYTWFCEYNFPYAFGNLSRKDLYKIWAACHCINYFITALKNLSYYHDDLHRFMHLTRFSNMPGRFSIREEKLYYRMHPGMSFSEKMHINDNNSYGYIDCYDGDIATMALYLFSGIPYYARQTKSISNGDDYTEFVIEPSEENRSEVVDVLIRNLLNINSNL